MKKNEINSIRIGVESLAPFDTFGGLPGLGRFEGDGDNRTFDPDDKTSSDSARIRYYVKIDTKKNEVIEGRAYSTGTHNVSTGERATAKIHQTTEYNSTSRTLNFSYGGADPLVKVWVPKIPFLESIRNIFRPKPPTPIMPNPSENPLFMSINPAPDIDVEGALKFRDEEDGLRITGLLKGDGFPATEAYVHFNGQDKGVMLGSSPIKAGTDKDWGPMQLMDGGIIKLETIMKIDISIKFDKNHIPTQIINHLDKNKTYTIEQWNNLHKDKPMLTPTPEAFKCSQEPVMDNHTTCVQDQSQMLHSLSNQKTSNEQINTSSKYTIVNNGIKLHADTNTTKAEDIKRAPNSTVDSISAGKDFVKDLNLSTDNSDNHDQGYGIGD